jgi:hypothetical protein|nr:MAG: hypothetical protein DIU62_00405 [Pseudomonadota bacterium]
MESSMRKLVAIVTFAALGLGAHAASAQGFSYNLIEGSLISGDDYDGFGVAGSMAFTSELFGLASIDAVEIDNTNIDGSLLSAGVGYRIAINQAVDVFGTGSIKRAKFDGSDGDWGFGLGVGVRGRPMSQLELHGGLEYVDINDSDTTFKVGGRWYFTPNFAAGLDFQDNDGGSALRFAVRYDFGRR